MEGENEGFKGNLAPTIKSFVSCPEMRWFRKMSTRPR